MKKILIIEDDVNLREELKILLEQNGYQASILECFENVVLDVFNSSCDLILLDIGIPGVNGSFLLKEIRKESDVPVIMVTSRNTELDEVICMGNGADDYITKPYHPQILLLRIEAVLRRFQPSKKVLSYHGAELHLSKSTLVYENTEVLLSKNEFQIFWYLLEHVGNIVSREEMMEFLWDTDVYVDDNTLTVNINRLRKKLEEVGLSNVIETRRGQGYILL